MVSDLNRGIHSVRREDSPIARLPGRVPKELISRFVKICPTCQVRRGGSRLTPPRSHRGSPHSGSISESPRNLSPPMSRRVSTYGVPLHVEKSRAELCALLNDQNAWINGHQVLTGRSGMHSGSDDVLHQNAANVEIDAFVGDIPTPQSCFASECAAGQSNFS